MLNQQYYNNEGISIKMIIAEWVLTVHLINEYILKYIFFIKFRILFLEKKQLLTNCFISFDLKITTINHTNNVLK